MTATSEPAQGPLGALDTFERLREAYFKYYDTPFGLADERLEMERRSLLDIDGGSYRRPLVEMRPTYVTGMTLDEAAAAGVVSADLAAFAQRGLIPPGRPLYRHQEQAAARAAEPGKHVVITAGTGSGKTESFLLPIVESLLSESSAWSGGTGAATRWWDAETSSFAAKRTGETGREAAVRALVLYPMNALVDDQLLRLRAGLDSQGARDWLDGNRNGHRFYFGRYTGTTPVTGARDDSRALADLRRYMRRTEARGRAASSQGGGAEFFVPRTSGAELLSRWDMADFPPDILITNYSMLNVMLLRFQDAHFFERTKAWLDGGQDRRFTLVVDELHSYRGTAGTEVAFLVRNLKRRLGLDTRPDKLRVMAASASLDAARDRDYLEGFFGLPASSFELLPGELAMPEDPSASVVPLTSDLVAGHRLTGAAARPAASALRAAFFLKDGEGALTERLEALSLEELGARLFPGSDADVASTATSGLLNAASRADGGADWPGLRAHLFFRNVVGIWACVDPRCTSIPGGSYPDRTVGRLFASPATRCICGSRVLELLYCQECGDVFLGGFTPEEATQQSHVRTTLLADVPELAQLPDQALLRPTAANYLVYWPRTNPVAPALASWNRDGTNVHYSFRRSRLVPASGELTNSTQDATGWSFHVQSSRARSGEWTRDPASLSPFPTDCPSCEAEWEVSYGRDGRRLPHTNPLTQRSPVRGMRTGFEKINQVLVSELAALLGDGSRKLIAFTDSRQDAAKLSAGIALRHYQDLLRLLMNNAVQDQTEAPQRLDLVRRLFVGRERTAESADALAWLRAADGAAADRLSDIWAFDAPEEPEGEADALAARLSAPAPLTALRNAVSRELLQLGVNPGGPAASLQEAAGSTWSSLYTWTPVPRPRGGLTDGQTRLAESLQSALLEEMVDGLFSGVGRDFESLGLGWLAVDHQAVERAADSPLAAARSSLRVLASAKRFMGMRRRADRAPSKLRRYWAAVASARGISFGEVQQQVLESWGDAVLDYLIDPAKASLRPAGVSSWVCGTCRRQHLHRGCGVCTNCRRALPAESVSVSEHSAADYYTWKAGRGDGQFRLACAELTGQTDRADAQSRQSRFQDVFLNSSEERLPDGLDLLSVTTTMEAGVDIGALEAVVLGNMPPTRFNYQQRVGRAGRRQSPLAVALTVCRGRSHDEYYFQRPELIANEPTPKPYLALGREEIFRRALASEVLRQMFSDITPILAAAGVTAFNPNVHGAYGLAADWAAVRPAADTWLAANMQSVAASAHALADKAPDSLLAGEPVRWVETELLDRIGKAAGGDVGHGDLSQRLAEVGLLPMFGFPSRVRHLYLKRPYRGYPWPPDGVVDRDLAMAVSQFSPMSEIVRDGRVYPVVGISAFGPGRPAPRVEPDPLGREQIIGLCRACSYLERLASRSPGERPCPQCGAPPGVFGEIDMREPLGFRAGPARDFDGNFSWSARSTAARALPDLLALTRTNVDAALVLSGPGNRYTINDNNGRQFAFRADTSGRQSWGGYVADEAIRDDLVSSVGIAQDVTPVALGAIQPTDFLYVGPAAPTIPAKGLRLNVTGTTIQPHGARDPNEGRRAAWFSTAFLLRAVAAAKLDVQQQELVAGIYSGITDGGPNTFAFIADTLENGAGFCTHLGEAEELVDLFGRASTYLAELGADRHSSVCSASCYSCLRDYNNMSYHALLDWRLARDLFAVLTGASLPIEPEREEAVLGKWAEGYGAEMLAGFPVAAALRSHPADGRHVVIARHPLEAAETDLISPRLGEALAAAEMEDDLEGVVFADTFTLDRDPGRVLTMIGEVTRDGW